MRKWTLDYVSPIPDLGSGYTLVRASVSGSGAGLFLFATDRTGVKKVDTGQGTNPILNYRARYGDRLALVVVTPAGNVVHDLGELGLVWPLVDLFRDGRILVAASRCAWRDTGDFDLNGVILEPVSGSRFRFLLGDGIQDLAVDDAGRIWASYYDEGVYGNYGWNRPGPPGPGEGGVVCFDDAGAQSWCFQPSNDDAFMDDCYAMNVTGQQAYVFYCSDFKLCRIDADFSRQYWTPGLSGCHSLAVAGDQVLFSAQYKDPQSRFYLLKFGGDALNATVPLTLALPSGAPLANGRVFGRGPNIHFFNSDGWFRGNIARL